MALFDIKNGNIILNPDSLVLPGFREIWKKDKTKGKTKGFEVPFMDRATNFLIGILWSSVVMSLIVITKPIPRW